MMIIPKTVREEEKYGTNVISILSDVQLGVCTTVKGALGMTGDLLDRDLAKCRWFNIQCNGAIQHN